MERIEHVDDVNAVMRTIPLWPGKRISEVDLVKLNAVRIAVPCPTLGTQQVARAVDSQIKYYV